MFWVAAAGPAANFVMAMGWAALLKFAWAIPGNPYALPLAEMSKTGISINVVLMVLNLLPLPPLDGGRIAVSLLPAPLAWRYARIEPFGFPILILLLFTGLLDIVLWPLIGLAQGVIATLFQLY
jgi:Zn-dependent protease